MHKTICYVTLSIGLLCQETTPNTKTVCKNITRQTNNSSAIRRDTVEREFQITSAVYTCRLTAEGLWKKKKKHWEGRTYQRQALVTGPGDNPPRGFPGCQCSDSSKDVYKMRTQGVSPGVSPDPSIRSSRTVTFACRPHYAAALQGWVEAWPPRWIKAPSPGWHCDTSRSLVE